jgi:hypothetical protein
VSEEGGEGEGGEGEEPEIHVIDSHDCKKTISLLNKEGKIALPHLLFADYSTLIMNCVEHCEANRSLLRYFDVAEIVRFIEKVQPFLREDKRIESWFKSIDTVTLHSIKLYYLTVLRELPAEQWTNIYQYMTDTLQTRFVQHNHQSSGDAGVIPERGTRVGIGRFSGEATQELRSENGNGIRKIKSEATYTVPPSAAEPKPLPFTRQMSVAAPPPLPKPPVPASSGILLTTADAYTLTDGPTIYLAEDIEKIGRFYIQQSKIPTEIFQSVLQKISKNNELSSAIEKLEKKIEDIESKFSSVKEETSGGGGGYSKKGKKKSSFNEKKSERNPELLQLYNEIDTLRKQIHYLAMDPKYIPNTRPHQKQWAPLPDGNTYFENAYVGKIDETTVKEVMSLNIIK